VWISFNKLLLTLNYSHLRQRMSVEVYRQGGSDGFVVTREVENAEWS
jgi:hypothetical protein